MKKSSTSITGADKTLETITKTLDSLREEISLLKKGKANKDEMSITTGTGDNADKATIQLKNGTEVTVVTEHQDISGKVDKNALAGEGYDFSKNRDIIRAGADVAEALGAEVSNNPATKE